MSHTIHSRSKNDRPKWLIKSLEKKNKRSEKRADRRRAFREQLAY